jgi:sec-independent protein translocase protein TatA
MEWILLIIAVALLLFGAKKIPEFARGLGKAKAEFQRGQMMVEREIHQEQRRLDREDKRGNRVRRVKDSEKSSDVVKAAKALGIETEGKSESQLKAEISEKMK